MKTETWICKLLFKSSQIFRIHLWQQGVLKLSDTKEPANVSCGTWGHLLSMQRDFPSAPAEVKLHKSSCRNDKLQK